MRTQTSVRKHVANTTIAQAWERFNDTGSCQSTAIRKVISRGWKKSRELGISVEKERAPTVITAEEIAELQRTEDLIKASKPLLSQLEHTLVETQHVLVLADANSRILYSTGHRPIQEQLEQINFRPGAEWSEHQVGPNGVGTSLSLGRPEIVMGYEHYCKAWQPWVCYGAPIYDASGKIVKGTIDITGPVDMANKESMAMAITLAQSISANLAVAQFQSREKLRELGKLLLQKWRSNAVLILDEYGYIVDYNNNASVLLGHGDSHFLNCDIANLLPEINPAFTKCLATGKTLAMDIHHLANSCPDEVLKVELEPVINEGSCLGVAIVFEAGQTRLALPDIVVGKTADLKAVGDEVIKKTLVKTNYNISKAAKLLGIDRTTIYRRMRKWS